LISRKFLVLLVLTSVIFTVFFLLYSDANTAAADPPDIKELLITPPPGQNIINLKNKGLKPGDDITPYLENWVKSGNQVRIPEGRYTMNSGPNFQNIADASIIGEGEVILDRGHEHRNRILIRADGDFEVRNLILKGKAGERHGNAFNPAALNPEAAIILRDIKDLDGAIKGSSGGIFVPKQHAGRLIIINMEVRDGITGLYASPPGLPDGAGGEIHVIGGRYKNHNIANVRFGTDNSSMRYVISIQDERAPEYLTHDSVIQRGYWPHMPGQNMLIENSDFIAGGDASSPTPLVLSDGSSGTLHNLRIMNDSNVRAISIRDSDWTASNVHLTGDGNLDIGPGEIELDSIFRKEEAESPRRKPYNLEEIFMVDIPPEITSVERKNGYINVTAEDQDVLDRIVLSFNGITFSYIEGVIGREKAEIKHSIQEKKFICTVDKPGDFQVKIAAYDQAGNRSSIHKEEYTNKVDLINAGWKEKDEEFTVRVSKIIPSAPSIYWEMEDEEGLTYKEGIFKEAMKRARLDYDFQKHRTYFAFTDPDFRYIMDGEWEKAGYSTIWDAAEALIYKLALTGSDAPDRDPELLLDIFLSSQLYQECFDENEYYIFNHKRYYTHDEQEIKLLYSSEIDIAIEDYKRENVDSYYISENKWLNAVELTDLKPGVEYRAYIQHGEELSRPFIIKRKKTSNNYLITTFLISTRRLCPLKR